MQATGPLPSIAEGAPRADRATLDSMPKTVSSAPLRDGRLVWERTFPAPQRVRLHDVAGGRALDTVVEESNAVTTRLLRTADGSDEAVLPIGIAPSLQAPVLGPDATVALASMHVLRPGGARAAPSRRIAFEPKRFGALAIDAEVGSLHFSPSGRHVLVSHRNGRLSAVDLESGRAVAIATADTSAAERAPNELYVIDLQMPIAAFGRDEASRRGRRSAAGPREAPAARSTGLLAKLTR